MDGVRVGKMSQLDPHGGETLNGGPEVCQMKIIRRELQTPTFHFPHSSLRKIKNLN